MSNDYRPMWSKLGLNLEAHDGLLAVLGKMYGETFLTQQQRPEGMGYLDFVMSEIHGLRIQELVEARAAGRKVIGAFCLYVPEEIVVALDAVCVGLCAGAEVATEAVEEILPRNTCALIKAFVGFKLAGVCPYVEACDLVVGETTCDGKTKAYEAFARLKDTFVIEVPSMKTDASRALWRSEVRRLATRLEEVTGKKLDAARLLAGIRTVDAKRRALHRLSRLRQADPAPISGLDALLVNQVQFYDDPLRFTAKINELCDELEGRVARGEGVAPKGTKRILVSGCPMSAPNWKLHGVVEQAGAVIVGEESCVGDRGTRNLVGEAPGTLDELLDRVADRYLAIDCAVFTPNHERLAHVKEMAAAGRVDGVIHYALQFCTPYQAESFVVADQLRRQGTPTLRIETDYGVEDLPQLRTRVEAFLETLG